MLMNKITIIGITASVLYSLSIVYQTYPMNALAPQKNPTFDHQMTQAILSRSPSRVTKVLDAYPNSINKLHSSILQAPLHASIIKCCNSITTLLLDRQADINITSGGEHMTPLYYAVMYGNAKIVTLLLSQKADTEIPSKDGLTPLHKAAQCAGPSSIYIFNKLIEAGASIDCQDAAGKTLLDVARSNPMRTIISDLQRSKTRDCVPARQIMADLPSPQNTFLSLAADAGIPVETNSPIPTAAFAPIISANSPELAAHVSQHNQSLEKENISDEDDKYGDDADVLEVPEISLDQWVLIDTQ